MENAATASTILSHLQKTRGLDALEFEEMKAALASGRATAKLSDDARFVIYTVLTPEPTQSRAHE